MAQQVNNADYGKNQRNAHCSTPSFDEPAKLLTSESSSDDSVTDSPSRTIHEDLPKVRYGRASLSSHGGDNKKYARDCCKLLVWWWRWFVAVFLRLLHACGMKRSPRIPRIHDIYELQGTHDIYELQSGTWKDSENSEEDSEDSEEGNHYGNCSTSGNQIWGYNVQRRESSPNTSPKPPPPPGNESKGLPNPIISPKQVEPGTDQSGKNGCFRRPWGKRKVQLE